ncbi:MAG: hypothetical protein SPF87_04840 [Bacilli bacterium]|nr:hypothetical protein [Bacilli bacterium]
MKKKSSLLLLTLSGVLLSGCVDTSSTSSTPESGGQEVSPVSRVIRKLGNHALAFKTTYEEYYDYGEGFGDEPDYSSVTTSLATNEFAYFKEEAFGEVSETRFENNWGNVTMLSVDVTTNELVETPIPSGDGYMSFTETFRNHFKYTEAMFEYSEPGVLELTAIDYFPAQKLTTLVAANTPYSPLSSLIVNYDVDTFNTTSVVATFMDDYSKSVYTIEPIDANTVTPMAAPTPVTESDGQAALQTALDSLNALNFKVTVSGKTTIWNYDEETGEETSVEADVEGSLTVTPVGYFRDQDPAFEHMLDGGAYVTAKGLQSFQQNADDGLYYDFRLPIVTYDVDTVVGSYFSFSAKSFIDNGDGTYSLPNVVGFYDNLSELIPDSRFGIGGYPDKGTFKIALTGEDIAYSYTCGGEEVRGVISMIGKVTSAFDFSSVLPYTPSTTMLEFFEANEIPDCAEAIEAVTENHSSIIPFIEPSMGYSAQANTRSKELEDGTVASCTYLVTLVYQAGSAKEVYDLMSTLYSELAGNEQLHYDAKEDGYVYTESGVDLFKYCVDFTTDYSTWTGNYDYALVVTVQKLNLPEWFGPIDMFN